MRRREFLGCAAGAGLSGAAAAEPPAAGVVCDSADLDRAVRAALASKRLGQPVFVRLTAHGPGKAAEQLPRLAALAGQWLGQALVRLHAVGGKDGPASLTLLYAGGASALVSADGSKTEGALDLMILGSRGSLHHEAASSFHATNGVPHPALLEPIRRALATGAPVDVKEMP